MWKRLLLVTAVSAALSSAAFAQSMTVGFSQVGSESGWRAAETSVAKSEAQKRGITLKIADGQQKQENQIKAVRSFIAQGVDAIFIAPVVQTGWEPVLQEAKEANIPVFLLDRLNGTYRHIIVVCVNHADIFAVVFGFNKALHDLFTLAAGKISRLRTDNFDVWRIGNRFSKAFFTIDRYACTDRSL